MAFDPQGRAYVSNEYDGTLSVIDPATATVTATINGLGGALGDLGSHPEGMVSDPWRHRLYVAVTNRDLVAVVNTTTHAVRRLISVARPQGLGTAPTKLAISPDDQRCSPPTPAATRSPNSLSRPSGLLGRIPTALSRRRPTTSQSNLI